MKRYIVTWEFKNSLGKWVPKDYTNNGKGLAYEDAKTIAIQIGQAYGYYAKHIRIEEKGE